MSVLRERHCPAAVAQRPSGRLPSGGRSNSRQVHSFPGSASASPRVRRGRHGGLRGPSGSRGLRRENLLARGEGRDGKSGCGRRVGLSLAISRKGDTAPRTRERPFTGVCAGRDGRKPGPSRGPRSFGSRGVRSVPPGHVAWVLAYAPDASLNFAKLHPPPAPRATPRAAHFVQSIARSAPSPARVPPRGLTTRQWRAQRGAGPRSGRRAASAPGRDPPRGSRCCAASARRGRPHFRR